MRAILKELSIGFSFSPEQKVKIPKPGGLIIVSNHSMGIADGMGLLSEIYHVRKDVVIMQGSVLRNTFGLGENSLEVDNLSGGISIKVYKQVKAHLNNGGVILMFPAGQVARKVAAEIQEGEWNSALQSIDVVSAEASGHEPDGKGVPVLLLQSLKLNATLLDFAYDPNFMHCLDALMLVDLKKAPPRLLKKYMGKEGFTA